MLGEALDAFISWLGFSVEGAKVFILIWIAIALTIIAAK